MSFKKYSINKYIFRIFAPMAILISLVISALLSLSEYKTNLKSRRESQRVMLATFSSSIRQPLIQGSLVEVQIRADELISYGDVYCVEVKTQNDSVKSCKKTLSSKEYLETSEANIKFSDSGDAVLSHIVITFDNSQMIFQLWKSSIMNILGFLILSLILFLAFLFGSSRIRFELIELLKLTQSDDFSQSAKTQFKIQEIDSVSEKIVKQFEIAKKEIEAKTALSTALQVAHDIRSPIVSLKMAVSAMQSQPDDKAKGLIVKSAQRISDIADDVIKQYSPNKTEPKGSAYLLNEALIDAVEEKRLICQDRIKITLSIEEAISIFAIKMKVSELKRALSNIIDNSIQAISSKGTIQVQCRLIDGKCFISVSDDGSGIDASILEQILKEGGTFGKSEGKGLGLSWVKAIVQKYNGQLLMNSKEQIGTEVTLVLPAEIKKKIKPELSLVTNEV